MLEPDTWGETPEEKFRRKAREAEESEYRKSTPNNDKPKGHLSCGFADDDY